jgi:Myb-like DNA-binding domain
MEISSNDIKDGDVQIVDRQFLEPEQVQNSFYHELIRNCAEKLNGNANVIQPASRMVDIVAKKRQGRFIFCHHTANAGASVRFYLLSREEAIAKLGSDLTTRLHEMNKPPGMTMLPRPSLPSSSSNGTASAAGPASEPAAAKPKPPPLVSQPPASLIGGTDTQLTYAVRLVLKVCMAEIDARKSPLDAARILNHSVLPNGEVETPKQRKLRMQIRLRFLAVARTETSVFAFARNLLRGWGVDVTKKNNLMISSVPGFKCENDAQGFPKSLPPTFLERGEVKPPPAVSQTTAAAQTTTRTTTALDRDNGNCRSGIWTTEERRFFVEQIDELGWGSWKELHKRMPGRYVSHCRRRPRFSIAEVSLFLSLFYSHVIIFFIIFEQVDYTNRHICSLRAEKLWRP